MNVAQYYNENVGLVHAMSKKGFARLQKAGVAMDYEDVFQEMSVVFLKTYQGFDASKGFQFSTYFYIAAQNRLSNWTKKVIDERITHRVMSIEEINFNRGDEEVDLESILPGDDTTPEQIVGAKQCVADMAKTLSPIAMQIIEWMVEPPKQYLHEIDKIEAHCAFAKSVGVERRAYTQITPRSIGQFLTLLGVDQALVAEALREIKCYSQSQLRKFF